MSTRHTHRYHLLCARGDATAAQKALDAVLPGWVGLVSLEEPTLSGASGQWTEEEAAQVLHVVEGIPGLKAWRGPALGINEPGVTVVDKGGNATRPGDLRLTLGKAAEEFQRLTPTAEETPLK